ncbi:MAG: hypothetical protein ACK5IM_14220 [Demequina sp.]|uniref:hypothetical protein n=1 Tax=Demequina sp. TaxID=2050685 RepID=UPI003A85B61E
MRQSADEVLAARAEDLPHEELLRFAVHRDPQVRATVAGRADTPAGALISLGYDSSPDVLMALLANPRTPSSVVRKLSDHRLSLIAEAAVQRLRNNYR